MCAATQAAHQAAGGGGRCAICGTRQRCKGAHIVKRDCALHKVPQPLHPPRLLSRSLLGTPQVVPVHVCANAVSGIVRGGGSASRGGGEATLGRPLARHRRCGRLGSVRPRLEEKRAGSEPRRGPQGPRRRRRKMRSRRGDSRTQRYENVEGMAASDCHPLRCAAARADALRAKPVTFRSENDARRAGGGQNG